MTDPTRDERYASMTGRERRATVNRLLEEFDRAHGSLVEQRALLAADAGRASLHLLPMRAAAEDMADVAHELLRIVRTTRPTTTRTLR